MQNLKIAINLLFFLHYSYLDLALPHLRTESFALQQGSYYHQNYRASVLVSCEQTYQKVITASIDDFMFMEGKCSRAMKFSD